MKPTSTILALATLLLAGCATSSRPPTAVAHIQLARVDSATVRVEKIWLEHRENTLVITGCVQRRTAARSSARVHLDVTAYDASDRVLRSAVWSSPILGISTSRFHRPAHLVYNVPLDPLPAETVRIEVRAHEAPHRHHPG